jgi:Gluconolactonase
MKILTAGLQFPEGPIALSDGSILLVEIATSTVTHVAADGEKQVIARVPGGLNGAAVGPDGRIYLCNNGGFEWIREQGTLRPTLQARDYINGSIDVLDVGSGAVQRLYDHCGGFNLRGPNDLVFDRDGNFYFTDFGKRRARDMDRGFVYWARADGTEIREVAGPFISPNGIGLSPDESALYVAETDTGRLWSFEIEQSGVLLKEEWPSPHGGTLVLGMPGFCRFDSLAVTSSGNICIAALSAAAIIEVSPDGTRLRTHPVPDLGVTNVCFGGDDMRTAYITLSHEGRLAAMRWHEPGLRLNFQGACSLQPKKPAS